MKKSVVSLVIGFPHLTHTHTQKKQSHTQTVHPRLNEVSCIQYSHFPTHVQYNYKHVYIMHTSADFEDLNNGICHVISYNTIQIHS